MRRNNNILDKYLKGIKGAPNACVALKLIEAKDMLTIHEYRQLANSGAPISLALFQFFDTDTSGIDTLIERKEISCIDVINALIMFQ